MIIKNCIEEMEIRKDNCIRIRQIMNELSAMAHAEGCNTIDVNDNFVYFISRAPENPEYMMSKSFSRRELDKSLEKE